VGAVAAVAAGSLAGCTGSDRHPSSGRPQQSRDAEPDPDIALARRALTRERAILQQVTATVHAHPGLAGVLAGTRAAHRAHVQLLVRAVPAKPASPSATATASGDHPHVPSESGAALASLAHQEARLAQLGRESAQAARSGAFARVLASAAAASAQQVRELTAAAGNGR
jgi:hypothetical protein